MAQLRKDSNQFLAQKAKMNWISQGDENTAFFHRAVKMKHYHQQVLDIKDMYGNICVGKEAVLQEYYQVLLGSDSGSRDQINTNVILSGPIINDEMSKCLNLVFTKEEVRKTLFSIPGNKAPGPDGYNRTFYKKCWDIIGEDITKAILDLLLF